MSANVPTLTFEVPERMRRLERQSLGVGLVAAIASIIGAVISPEHFLRSYLVAFMFWLGITLGSLAILMLTHVTTAQWGYPVRRVLEAAGRNIIWMALFFIPIIAGMSKLYPWAAPGAVNNDQLLKLFQRQYLNAGGFIFRAILYFVCWVVLAFALSRWSWSQDSPPDRSYRRRFQNFCGAGLVIYGWTMTFASIDWMMSLDNHWRSTIYGFYVMAGQGLIAFSFLIIVAALLWRFRPLSEVMTATHLHDMGKLMFAFLILWAYMAFSQGLIYWSGNVPAEISWYLNRTTGGWWWIGLALILLHFVVPFFLLLSQNIKRDAGKLIVIAVWMIVMRWIDLYWLIVPNFPDTKGHLVFSWMNVATTLAIGGLWVFAFLLNLQAHPLIARYDPMLYQVLEAQEHGH